MPPWYVNEDHIQYSNSLKLSNVELNLLKEWYAGGCLKGEDDSSIEDAKPFMDSTTQIDYQFVDYTVFKAFSVPSSDKDKYLRVSLIPANGAGKPNSLDLIGIKFNPGNKKVVHHAELYAVEQKNNGDSLFLATDYFFLNDHGVMPGYGYRFISSWLPGQDIDYFPNGTVKSIQNEESLVLLIHYSSFPKEELDSTTVRFYIKPDASDYEAVLDAKELTVIDQNAWNPERIFIAANTIDTITLESVIESDGDLSIFALHPHAHHLCRKMNAVLISPKGDTCLLLDLPHWDFDWQHFYRFKKFIKASIGSKVRFTAIYDNTADNPENPFNPPQDVYSSFRADDEMMVLFILAKEYEKGDENQVVKYPLIPLKYH